MKSTKRPKMKSTRKTYKKTQKAIIRHKKQKKVSIHNVRRAAKKYPNIFVQPTCGIKQTVEEKLGLPEKPKRPVTAFFKFLQQIRPSLYQENPNIKNTDVGKVAAQKWEKVDPKLKSELEAEFKREMETYHIAKANYESGLTSKQKIDLKEAKLEELHSKEKKMLKKKVKDLGRPKKPATSFLKYMKERQHERGNTPMIEWQRKLSKEWETESEATKAKYNEILQQEKLKYQQDLVAWEQKMIKLGHMDVVRTEALLPKANNNK